jgi:hypothetical protein
MGNCKEALFYPSVAANCSTYEPAAENAASVTGLVGSAYVMVPGPLTSLQVLVTVCPAGNAESVMVPVNSRVSGRVTVVLAATEVLSTGVLPTFPGYRFLNKRVCPL